MYIEEAKRTLLRVVECYKNLYGKSDLDQKQLIGEPYKHLIWFVFPSEVLPELLALKYASPLTFSYLESYVNPSKQIEPMPF